MKVQELIDELQKIEDKTKKIIVGYWCDGYDEANEIAEKDDEVTILV